MSPAENPHGPHDQTCIPVHSSGWGAGGRFSASVFTQKNFERKYFALDLFTRFERVEPKSEVNFGYYCHPIWCVDALYTYAHKEDYNWGTQMRSLIYYDSNGSWYPSQSFLKIGSEILKCSQICRETTNVMIQYEPKISGQILPRPNSHEFNIFGALLYANNCPICVYFYLGISEETCEMMLKLKSNSLNFYK